MNRPFKLWPYPRCMRGQVALSSPSRPTGTCRNNGIWYLYWTYAKSTRHCQLCKGSGFKTHGIHSRADLAQSRRTRSNNARVERPEAFQIHCQLIPVVVPKFYSSMLLFVQYAGGPCLFTHPPASLVFSTATDGDPRALTSANSRRTCRTSDAW